MNGRIVKAVSDFYYVYDLDGGEVYACKAKGIFRKKKDTPLVGDICTFEITNTKDIEGNITSIKPRKSRLYRPAVANIDQALVVFAIRDPDPGLYLLDRFLVNMENMHIPAVIVFNKTDKDEGREAEGLQSLYGDIGYKCLLTSVYEGAGIDEVKQLLSGKVTSVAGPSGVGKSSLINAFSGKRVMETGDVSEKTRRGKQTTRHTQLVSVGNDTFIVDTPGFSNTFVEDVKKEELGALFPEFVPYLDECRFSGCSHISEPDCGVKTALDEGKIAKSRYTHYKRIYGEISSQRY